MKTPTEKRIIEEVESLKRILNRHDFQMGIGGNAEKEIKNKVNKILRMLKKPTMAVDYASFEFHTDTTKTIKDLK